MKKYIYFLLILLAFSCTKDKVELAKTPFVDYRSKFLGTWEFDVAKGKYHLDSSNGGFYFYESFTYLGEIKLGPYSDELLFKYSENDSIVLTVDKANSLSNFPSSYSGGHFYGDTSVEIYLHWGGKGAYTMHYFEGIKK